MSASLKFFILPVCHHLLFSVLPLSINVFVKSVPIVTYVVIVAVIVLSFYLTNNSLNLIQFLFLESNTISLFLIRACFKGYENPNI